MQAAKNIETRHLPAVDRFKRYGRLDQSIGNDETNTFQLKFCI